MEIPNETKWLEDRNGFFLVEYKGRVRRMAIHHYIKPLLSTNKE
ncbi:hypothetical protein LCGC14_2177840 [marine sediment metagenome]|uniref:Uncharacterized protein n=1 Tax=marine sediment metagenome TaxID=412755 RepID=A0A0F9DN50_9ZZZZ